jgi:archaemetzincin
MKIALTILTIIALQTNCRKYSIISLQHNNDRKIIGLQPLGDYDTNQLTTVSKEIADFFKTRVLILRPITIPRSFYFASADKYSADSLIQFLSKFVNDTIVKIVGVTHTNIYTLHKYYAHLNKKRSVSYEYSSIFGLGYIGGNTSVVSDYRLQSNDKELFDNRLRKVILHELGHNLGLSHCTVDSCLMSETNGDIGKLNKTGGDYCKKCRGKLN